MGRWERWGGVVLCLPGRSENPPPVYAGDGFCLHGQTDACRAFAADVGID